MQQVEKNAGAAQNMKKILIITVFAVIFAGCSGFRPAVGDPVGRDESVRKTDLTEAKPISKQDKINVSQEKRQTPADRLSYSVSDLDIAEKNNGVMITLNYRGDDPKSNITTFFSGDNFFNISLYKGSFTESVKNYIFNKSVVSTVKFFEFKDSIQITVRLKKDYNSSHVITQKGKIIISVFN
jgi:hypothetical protein